jgi:uncharacterized membrane protein YeaQ/YmgE (transglycosylase-associated protein family)
MTVLGIAGAFVATFIGQPIGWYSLDQGAGFIGATVGALIVWSYGTDACGTDSWCITFFSDPGTR